MIAHVITAAAFTLLGLTPAASSGDTPTTPIDSATMSTLITSGNPAVNTACDSYRNLTAALDELGAATGADSQVRDVLTEWVDAYVVVTVEGDSLRLSPEARTDLVDWLHNRCTA